MSGKQYTTSPQKIHDERMRQLVSSVILENSKVNDFTAIEERYITINEQNTITCDHVTNECVIVCLKRMNEYMMSCYCIEE